MYEIANIDKFGRILIPKDMRTMLGLDKSSTVFIEDRDHELVIKPVHKKANDVVKKISMMELPVEDWESMEQEIEEGALDG
jgi:AbrB family looped-hinge helix DNA binding protein